eukprot:145525-Heterocapsa_arctica.AAC.1
MASGSRLRRGRARCPLGELPLPERCSALARRSSLTLRCAFLSSSLVSSELADLPSPRTFARAAGCLASLTRGFCAPLAWASFFPGLTSGAPGDEGLGGRFAPRALPTFPPSVAFSAQSTGSSSS